MPGLTNHGLLVHDSAQARAVLRDADRGLVFSGFREIAFKRNMGTGFVQRRFINGMSVSGRLSFWLGR